MQSFQEGGEEQPKVAALPSLRSKPLHSSPLKGERSDPYFKPSVDKEVWSATSPLASLKTPKGHFVQSFQEREARVI